MVSIGERYSFRPETVIRFRIIIEILGQSSPDVIKDNIQRILVGSQNNVDLKPIIKKELEISIKQHFSKETRLLEEIRDF